jgi:murein DD-endopeptidase MepM/ murein hydrolase activator NlpD
MTRRGLVGVWRLALAAAALVWAGCGEDKSVGTDGGSSSPAARAGSGTGKGVAEGPGAKVALPRPVNLVWPTPNDAYLRGAPLERFVQATASGEINSGLFGSTRSGGRQFHEGLDLFPLQRDARGEALDPIFAVMDGVVRHVSPREGASSYGRYVVLEHPEQSPPVYTLYAHLARIEPGVVPGRELRAGETLGLMGRSASGYTIPKERAHLHLEIGVRMSDRFQEWYDSRGFGSRNEHGLWNGMNLMGLDPLEFYARRRAGGLFRLDEVFAAQPVAVTVRVAATKEPDYVRRYPSLVEPASAVTLAGGWEIDLGATGVPLRWRRLAAAEVAGWRTGEVRIVRVDEELLGANRGRKLVRTVRGAPTPDEDLRTVLEQLFLWKR